mmetsp:Transcript_122141/g.211890  ORF Transcript_122141/g.211890 Transcript_122141/m.211890 type:complete len:237 (-) Transcript_122141:885-1595(-)
MAMLMTYMQMGESSMQHTVRFSGNEDTGTVSSTGTCSFPLSPVGRICAASSKACGRHTSNVIRCPSCLSVTVEPMARAASLMCCKPMPSDMAFELLGMSSRASKSSGSACLLGLAMFVTQTTRPKMTSMWALTWTSGWLGCPCLLALDRALSRTRASSTGSAMAGRFGASNATILPFLRSDRNSCNQTCRGTVTYVPLTRFMYTSRWRQERMPRHRQARLSSSLSRKPKTSVSDCR